jgi:hypothetical protein
LVAAWRHPASHEAVHQPTIYLYIRVIFAHPSIRDSETLPPKTGRDGGVNAALGEDCEAPRRERRGFLLAVFSVPTASRAGSLPGK